MLTLSRGEDGVMLQGKFVSIPATDWILVSGTAKEAKEAIQYIYRGIFSLLRISFLFEVADSLDCYTEVVPMLQRPK